MPDEKSGVRKLLRTDIWSLAEYEAPEALEEFARRMSISIDEVVKLDQNENPYGPSPKVLEALGRLDRLHIYPDPFARRPRTALASYVGVGPERLAIGNGADELLEVLFRLFLTPGDIALSFGPTFGYYATIAGSLQASMTLVPRLADWSIEPGRALETIERLGERVKIIVVTSPNNPTGNLCPESTLRALLGTDRLVIADEAYFEFAGKTSLPLIDEYDNLVILRTFSKWAGLAGGRVGYGVFPAWLLPQIYKIKPPYGVSVTAQEALIASLEDRAYLEGLVERIVSERARLFDGLSASGYLKAYPSDANFILCEVLAEDGSVTGSQVRMLLEEYGILVRSYSDPRLRRAFRVSVGRPQDTDRLLAALVQIGERLGLKQPSPQNRPIIEVGQ